MSRLEDYLPITLLIGVFFPRGEKFTFGVRQAFVSGRSGVPI